ncbi:unnamed protein product [Thelazia callipaeda]|uniref:Microtubule-binding protein TANGLED n=1 Tax=Thelazia callipaeda TaxID=103827 RepID=A0A0N5CX73_THECL|nr:unnamed protein product [Thelazia callipaeda]
MADMMHWNPEKRPTAISSLKYRYFLVGEKLSIPTFSHPSTSNRKSSADSTLSDTRVVLGKTKILPNATEAKIDAVVRNINRNLPINKVLVEPSKRDLLLDKNSRTISGVMMTKAKIPAKELYMSRSRYMPGTINHQNVNATKVNTKANPAKSAVQARFEYAYGYVPSFGVKKNLSNNNANAKPSGRIDWTAK